MSWSKKSKYGLGALVVVILLATLGYQYVMRPAKSIEEKKAEYVGSATELLKEVNKDTQVWQDKVVSIFGRVTNLDDKGFMLSSTIFCQLKDSSIVRELKLGDSVSIKGRIIGYDDLLEEVKLDQCIIK